LAIEKPDLKAFEAKNYKNNTAKHRKLLT